MRENSSRNSACSIPDCGKPAIGRGWCSMHYKRWRLHGDPLKLAVKKLGPAQRWVLDVALKHEGDDCLTWPFYRSADGYGKFDYGGRPHNASRVVCELAHGAPSDAKLVAAHSCHNGHLGCVNPKHLRWATGSENERDKELNGTSNRGENHGGAKLTEEDVRAIRRLAAQARHKEIASMFGVSRWTVLDIARRKRWAWVE